jgi:hypothetical protein
VSVGQESNLLSYDGLFLIHRRMLGVPVGVPSKITLLCSVTLPSAPIAAQNTWFCSWGVGVIVRRGWSSLRKGATWPAACLRLARGRCDEEVPSDEPLGAAGAEEALKPPILLLAISTPTGFDGSYPSWP